MNYLNYLETKHIINMMLALHSDHQRQMRSIIDVMSMNEQEMIIVILQKNSIKTMSWDEVSPLDDSWNSIDPAAPRVHGDISYYW